MFLSVFHYLFKILASPVEQSLDMWQKRSAELRHRIFRPWGDVRKEFATDYAVGSQLAENLRQHLFRYRRDVAVQLVEAHRFVLGW